MSGYHLLLAMAPRKNSVWSVTFQCSASQRCSYMFVFALIGVEIEFIQPNDSLEKAETSEHQIDEAFSSLQSHRRPHIGGLPYPWALQFSTFPDEWYSKAYFHSHIINTFLPTPASNIPNHFRQCAHAILDRHKRRRWGEELRQLSDVVAEHLAELY